MAISIGAPLPSIGDLMSGAGGIGLAGLMAAQKAQQQGVANAYQAPMLAQHLLGMQIANALNKANVPFADANALSNAANLRARAQIASFQGQNPLITVPGVGGQVAGANLAQYGAPNTSILPGIGMGGQSIPVNTGAQISQPSPQGLIPSGNINQPGSAQSLPSQLPLSQQQITRLQSIYGQGGSPVNLADLTIQSAVAGKQKMIADANKAQADANLANVKVSGYNYDKLTDSQKNQALGQLVGAGLDPITAQNYLNKGYSIPQVMSALGYTNPNAYPAPNYGATTDTINTLKNNQATMSAMNTIEPKITQALGNYMPIIGQMSPSQFKDALTGMNQDAQAQFIAASMLAPEMAALRLKGMGGHVGEGAIKEIMDKSLQNVNPIKSLVTPKVFQQAQQYANEWLNESAGNYQSSLSSGKVTAAPMGLINQNMSLNQNAQGQKRLNQSLLTPENLAHTAQKYNMTVPQLKAYLQSQGAL